MDRRAFLRGLGALVAAPVVGETFSVLVPAEPRILVPGWSAPPSLSDFVAELRVFANSTPFDFDSVSVARLRHDFQLITAANPAATVLEVTGPGAGIDAIGSPRLITINDELMRVTQVQRIGDGIVRWTVERGVHASPAGLDAEVRF